MVAEDRVRYFKVSDFIRGERSCVFPELEFL